MGNPNMPVVFHFSA